MMEKKLYELTVDEELETTARALQNNEKEMLTEDILARGCLTPLITWNGVIIDGHNRYRICHQYNIPFGIEEVAFESKTDARIWIITNQLSRRNLSPFEKCELAFSMENDLKQLAEQRRKEAISRARQTGETLPPSPKTRDVLAEMTGVSPRTVDKIRIIIREADEDTKEGLRTGDKKIESVYTAIRKKSKPEEEKDRGEKHKEEKHKPTERETEPLTQLEESMEVPPMREEEIEPRPFEYVRDQVRFSVENMLKELRIGLNWLRKEDIGKADELVSILKDGYDRAAKMIKEAGK